MWAENFEACDTQPVKYLAFPYSIYYFRNVIVLHSFFNVLVDVTSVFTKVKFGLLALLL